MRAQPHIGLSILPLIPMINHLATTVWAKISYRWSFFFAAPNINIGRLLQTRFATNNILSTLAGANVAAASAATVANSAADQPALVGGKRRRE